MADRPRHPNKEIEAAVAYAEEQGWSWFKVKGHAWGKLNCARHDRNGCTVFVWSTPKVPENHARQTGARLIAARTRKEEKNGDDV